MQVMPPIDYGTVGLVLALKGLILMFGAIAYQVQADQPLTHWQEGLALWNRWDAPHYINIAENGYQATGDDRRLVVFFPLFPWLVRLVATLNGNFVLSGFLVSGLASVAAAVLLQELVRLETFRTFGFVASEQVASRTVWFFLIFPTSYFLHIGYTESLFIALVLGCLLAARRQQWWLAGGLGLLANLTRSSGIVLIPVLLVEVAQQYWLIRRLQRGWGWIALVPLGFAIYLLCNFLATGNPFEFLIHQREYWHKFLTFPWVGMGNRLGELPTSAPWRYQMVGMQEFFFIGLGLVGTVWSWLNLRPSYAIWMTGNWLLFTSTSHLLSIPRYTLVMFPLFVMFAQWSRNRITNGVITAWSLLFLALFIGQFVQGKWAF